MTRARTLGPFQLERRIAVGGLGEVWQARRASDGARVAVKRLMPSVSADPDVVDALRQEASVVRRLHHDHIATVVEHGEDNGTYFVAYEYVDGADLAAVVQRGAERKLVMPHVVAVLVAVDISAALAAAHAAADGPVVHRDVSPSNILLGLDGRAKLTDFGIARVLGTTSRTAAGQIKGTIGYLSPEQILQGPIDERTDIYALGVVLWELIARRRLLSDVPAQEPSPGRRSQSGQRISDPVSGIELSAMERIARGDIPDLAEVSPSLPEDLYALLRKMLALNPAERYATAAQLHRDLAKVAAQLDRGADRRQVALYLRDLFPEVAAEAAASGEESRQMADDKGGSDLDVFEGLAKKSQRPSALTPPPPSSRQAGTLMGVAPPSAPPASRASKPPAPLPPPSKRSGPPTLQGVGTLPPVSSPPKSATSTPAPLPPPSKKPPLPPLSGPPSKLPAPTPPPASKSLGSALGFGEGAAPKSSKPAPIEMDWDDEEESTHVYDKVKHGSPSGPPTAPSGPRPAAGAPPSKVGAAAALLAGSGGTAAPAARAPSVPPPSRPPPAPPIPSSRPTSPSGASVPARSRMADEPTDIRPRVDVGSGGGGSKLPTILAAIALLLVIGMGAFLFIPRSGDLKIDVRTASGKSVAKCEIFVDGTKVCDTAPCPARDLEAGSKSIKVIAPGLPPSDPVEATVEAGKEKLVLVELKGEVDEDGTDEADAEGTGFKAASKQKDVDVIVDGKKKGTLPVTLTDLKPGKHKVVFQSDARYEPLEKTIKVEDGKVEDLGDIELKVLKGDLVLELKTEGAEVTLVGKGKDKVEKRLPDSLWKSPPVKLEDLDADTEWTILATKKGYEDFEEKVSFDDGQAEKELTIELKEEGKAVASTTPPPPSTNTGSSAPPPSPPKEPPPPAGGNGTLNINSIPVSKVLLDGRPLGSTPKVGISVSPGAHTVTFIHPEKGRKSVTVNVPAGGTKTAAVKF